MINYLEKLLDGQKVEWRKLGEVCQFITTGKLNANAMTNNGQYPFFTCNEEPYLIDNYAFNMEAILISGNGSQVGHVNYYNGKFNAYQRTYVLGQFQDNLNIIYVLHYFKYCLKEYIAANSKKASVPYITLPMLQNFKLPIPPLSVQKEIVKILDKMTELEATLEAELTLRNKQYHYYRDLLLDYNNPQNPFSGSLKKVEWKTLGEVAIKISSGGTPKTGTDEYYNGNIPWLRTQEVNFKEIWDTGVKITEEGVKNSSAKWIPENCVIVAMYGATVGRVAINKIPMTTNQACANIQVDESILNYRYLFHYLSSQYEYIKSLGTGSQTNINAQIVKSLQIPIPSLETQAKIVAILDKFDTLTQSISEGLPKEIELRQKQYEYYRDQLLSFPKP